MTDKQISAVREKLENDYNPTGIKIYSISHFAFLLGKDVFSVYYYIVGNPADIKSALVTVNR